MSAQSLPYRDQDRAKICTGFSPLADSVRTAPGPSGSAECSEQREALAQDIATLTANHLVDTEAGLAFANTAQMSAIRIDCRALEESQADVVAGKMTQGSADFSSNAATGRHGSMTATDVIDPVTVTRLAPADAASAAGFTFATDCIVVEHPTAPASGPEPLCHPFPLPDADEHAGIDGQ
jgi:hypothetical protein